MDGQKKCALWMKNPSRDPETKQKISKNGNRWVELTRECHELKQNTDAPEYNPDIWNHPFWIGRFNCYDYAFNNRNPKQISKTQPGEISGKYKSKSKQINECNWVQDQMKSDHPELYATDLKTPCRKNMYKVALVTDNIGPDLDYHFLRQDSDGIWSHKPGAGAAIRLDSDENLITDPSSAKYNYATYQYNNFCGYFCTSKDSGKRFANKKVNTLKAKQDKKQKSRKSSRKSSRKFSRKSKSRQVSQKHKQTSSKHK